MAIIDKIYEENWTKKHSLPCVQNHLEKTTMDSIIYPTISDLQNNDTQKDEFIIQIAETLQTNHQANDITKIIECIIRKIMSVFEEKEFPMSSAFLSTAAFTSLGHCIFLLGKEAGYIR